MKTLTITLHDTDNCGSSLQSFALQHFLLSQGIDNELIDYVPSYTQNNGRAFKTFLRKVIFFKASRERKQKFADFKNRFLKLTRKKYTTYDELKKGGLSAEVYITGSDQLWNSMYLCGQDPAFYLDFVKEAKKIGYAVSLGREDIPEDNLTIVQKYAHGFSWLSLRESCAIHQLKTILPNVTMDYVCDPVLLNEVQEYEPIKSDRLIKDKYILVYLAQKYDKKSLDKVVAHIKGNKGVKVVFIGTYLNRCTCDIHIRDVAPGDFLSLIANAEYIISNSFHATVFSIMYNKQFIAVMPPENSSRIKEVLAVAGIKGHEYSKDMKVPYISEGEYEEVNKRIATFREKSRELLMNNLGK
ncbi:polysaccharide pyruvyl transferase family protein [Phascolarctobacterium sp.]|uniref:polysaccharide pyruvyl transferase family protein n=1 Tax=Phascolarctobacterium sp. TaxID=2049039 RepID=UPI003870225C